MWWYRPEPWFTLKCDWCEFYVNSKHLWRLVGSNKLWLRSHSDCNDSCFWKRVSLRYSIGPLFPLSPCKKSKNLVHITKVVCQECVLGCIWLASGGVFSHDVSTKVVWWFFYVPLAILSLAVLTAVRLKIMRRLWFVTQICHQPENRLSNLIIINPTWISWIYCQQSS